MKVNAVIGIDGGGSKTQFLLADFNGKIIASNILGPSTSINYNEQESILIQGIKNLDSKLVQHYSIRSVFISIGGYIDPQIVEVIKIITKADYIMVNRESSGFLISQCAPIWNFDIAVMAGTGSVAVGIGGAGEIIRNGGWGPIIDDRGSGYSLGKYGLRAITDFIDGRGEWTVLVPIIMGCGLICENHSEGREIRNFEEKLSRRYSDRLRHLLKDFLKKNNRYNTASLAPLVIKAANQQDIIAQNIVNSAGVYLAELVISIGEELRSNCKKESFTSIGIGGVFKAGEIIVKPFLSKIKEGAEYIKIEEKHFNLATGSIACSLMNAGIKMDNRILGNIKKYVYERYY